MLRLRWERLLAVGACFAVWGGLAAWIMLIRAAPHGIVPSQ
jgi:hypothetical protein